MEDIYSVVIEFHTGIKMTDTEFSYEEASAYCKRVCTDNKTVKAYIMEGEAVIERWENGSVC